MCVFFLFVGIKRAKKKKQKEREREKKKRSWKALHLLPSCASTTLSLCVFFFFRFFFPPPFYSCSALRQFHGLSV